MNRLFAINKKIVFAIISGVITVVLFRWLFINFLSSLLMSLIIKNTPISQMQSIMTGSLGSDIHFALQFVSIIIGVFAGGIPGYFSKNKGWLYGLLVGIISSTIYLHIYPLLLIETSIGGWIGEKLANSRKSS